LKLEKGTAKNNINYKSSHQHGFSTWYISFDNLIIIFIFLENNFKLSHVNKIKYCNV